MKTLGKIAGGIGLLLALTSVVTLFVTSGSLTVFAVKLGLGVAMIVLWAVTNGAGLANWARSAFFYSSSIAIGVVFLLLLGIGNYIVAKRDKTWDLTNKKIYSLSVQTETALKDLKEPVKIIAFVEGPAPEVLEDLFRRYRANSDEKFTYEFKDPRKNPDLALKYQLRQGQPAGVLVKGETHNLINLGRLANPQSAEQELTNGILKLTSVGSQKLYFLQGHGEWPLEPTAKGEEAAMASLTAIRRVLQDEGYAPEPLNLAERPEIPRDASAIVIAGARSKITDSEKAIITRYLDEGGRVFLLAEYGGDAGLGDVLAKWGVAFDQGVVADTRVSPEQPYMAISPFFGDHEITRLLTKARANVVFPTTMSITLAKDVPDVTATPLVLTTPYAWVESTISDRPELDSGEKTGQLTLAAAVTRNTAQVPNKRSDEARLLVFGDSEVLVGAFSYDPNRNLVMNSFAWATEQSKKITIRPPDRDISTIDLTADTLGTIRLLSMDLLPMLLIGIGLTIWLTRRAR